MFLSRRQFVAAGALGSVSVAAGCRIARTRDAWEALTSQQALILSVLCDQIIPADEFPGATQAGALVYIDRQLARHYSRHLDAYRDGIGQAEALSRKRFGSGLADAAPSQQFDIARALEKSNPAFFSLLRQHTMEGFYGTPRHGGNRDGVSWHMLGLAEPPLRGRAQYDLKDGGRS